MSIDLEIIPSKKCILKWNVILCDLRETGITELSLVHLGSDRVISNSESLVPELSCHIRPTRKLVISVESNVSCNTSEYDVIEEYGAAFPNETKLGLAQDWKGVGYFFGLSSSMGRTGSELWIMLNLAVSIARLVGGWVLLEDMEEFGLKRGAYEHEHLDRHLKALRKA